jgi:hypothetical protein
MTTAELAREEPDQAEPSEADLLDVLYEVLAQGVPPRSTLRSEDVERFLHEHARTPKTPAEMLVFFNEHKLPTRASEYGADPELGLLANGIHKDRPPLAMFAADEGRPELRSASESGPIMKVVTSAEVVAVEDTSPRVSVGPVAAPAAPERRRWSGLGVATLGLFVLMAGALVGSFQHAQGLRVELEQARLQQRSTDSALSALEQRAETLRASLTRSEEERRGLADRFDQFIIHESQKRMAEEVALERLLGPRFERLRDKALQDAYLASP